MQPTFETVPAGESVLRGHTLGAVVALVGQ
jgi:hypothetical protein